MTKPIKITPEMIEAALAVLEDSGRLEGGRRAGGDELLVHQLFSAALSCRHGNTKQPS